MNAAGEASLSPRRARCDPCDVTSAPAFLSRLRKRGRELGRGTEEAERGSLRSGTARSGCQPSSPATCLEPQHLWLPPLG